MEIQNTINNSRGKNKMIKYFLSIIVTIIAGYWL